MTKPITFAFVSGKGGVGKTMLAANFAWVCSRVAKTIIVDLDFQNQGCTGLFAPHVKLGKCNAIDAIMNAKNKLPEDMNQVAENLYFMPAVSWTHRIKQEKITQFVVSDDFPDRLEIFLENLMQSYDFEVVVLDCHGGVDAVSLSAFQASHHTLMVTESDSVAFAGTLELLSYYESKILTGNSERFSESSEAEKQSGFRKNVKFIVNRLPSKYKWQDLERIYSRQISKSLGVFTSDESVFCYIPYEDLLADSFGEFPFHVQLATNSIFTKKICFMAHSLLPETIKTRQSPRSDRISKLFAKLDKKRYLKKVERIVISNEAKNRIYILNMFASFSVMFLIFMIVGIPYIIYISNQESALSKFHYTILYILSACFFLPLIWFYVRAIFGAMFFFRDKYKYQKGLFKSISPTLTVWQKLSITKLFILRIATSILTFIMSIYILSLAMFLLVGLV